jgi:hypothetical protein
MESTPDDRLFQPSLEREFACCGDAAGLSVADDLIALVRLVETSLQDCDCLRHTAFVASSPDAQRDLLHMQARIGGIGRQVGDAIATFNRLQERFLTESARGRQVRPAPLSDRDARTRFGKRPSDPFSG